MTAMYRVKYTWPGGVKIRYHRGRGSCAIPENAEQFTNKEADVVLKKANDAYMVWGIKAEKEPINV